ncbi:MAG: atpD-A [Chlamydiales bacterium]|nr:atpD-A [Chlamydiales bacterium]
MIQVAQIKLTKNELRVQQTKLNQLTRYLPTLQLKKAMLQMVVNEARLELAREEEELKALRHAVESEALMLSYPGIEIKQWVQVISVQRRYENIAGVDVPVFGGVIFQPNTYDLADTPAFIDPLIESLQRLVSKQAAVIVAQEKKHALEKELREVSIRVNLFEKILIPRSLGDIKKIRVSLSDQQQAAVSRAKVAKMKIEERALAAQKG